VNARLEMTPDPFFVLDPFAGAQRRPLIRPSGTLLPGGEKEGNARHGSGPNACFSAVAWP
jgi:hypothetical protein